MSHEEKINSLRVQIKQAKSLSDQKVLAFRIRLLEWAVLKKTGGSSVLAYEEVVKQALF